MTQSFDKENLLFKIRVPGKGLPTGIMTANEESENDLV
jgi:hypothetical protein